MSCTQLPECPERAETHQRVLRLLKRFGYTANSFQTLQSQFEYWFSRDDACVAYVDTGKAWVAAGAPIATTRTLHRVALEFVQRGESIGRRVAFFGTESRFLQATGFRSLLLGRQPAFQASDWPVRVAASRDLRRQLRRARAKGLCIERLNFPNSSSAPFTDSRRSIQLLIDDWLNGKRLPPLGFLTKVQPFSFSDECRYFIARTEQRLFGAAILVPIYARRGWLIENLIRSPDAPNGTSESLIDAAVRYALASGDSFVTLGLTPLAGNVSACLRAAKRVSSWLYNFSGLEQFRAKLKPTMWSPVFLSYSDANTAPLAVYDSLVAFAHGDLVQYGMLTVSRWMSRASPKPILRPPEPPPEQAAALRPLAEAERG